MDPRQLRRYIQQIILPQVGLAGQRRLRDSRVLMVGLGGLGSPAALYLAAAGVGHLALADFDRVELSNLQRQILHRDAAIGSPKTQSARDTLVALNPDVETTLIDRPLEGAVLEEQVGLADVVVDGSDNFPTRFAVNAACVARRRPLVSGAAIRMQGQVTVFDPAWADCPCYRCLYADAPDDGESCTQNGVLAPVVGVIGSLQALEALKLLLGFGEPLRGRLLVWDALAMRSRILSLRRDPGCPACAGR